MRFIAVPQFKIVGPENEIETPTLTILSFKGGRGHWRIPRKQIVIIRVFQY